VGFNIALKPVAKFLPEQPKNGLQDALDRAHDLFGELPLWVTRAPDMATMREPTPGLATARPNASASSSADARAPPHPPPLPRTLPLALLLLMVMAAMNE
jgi:hypothetical protein